MMDNGQNRPLMMTLCLEEGSILISQAVLEALGSPQQIQMLINDEQKKLLIQACSPDMKEAIAVPNLQYMQIELSGHSLLKRICRLTGWTDLTPRAMFGRKIPLVMAIIFDLNEAVPAELQSRDQGGYGNG